MRGNKKKGHDKNDEEGYDMEDSWKSYEIQGQFTRCRKKI